MALAGAFKKAPKRSKRPGAALERYVASVLKGHLTRNSGAQDLDGDVRVGDIAIECKFTEKSGNYILKRAVYEEHNLDCAKRGLTPVWVLQRSDQPVVCIIGLQDFADMLSTIKDMAVRIRRYEDEENRT